MGPTDSDAVPDNGLDPELQRVLREVGPEGNAAATARYFRPQAGNRSPAIAPREESMIVTLALSRPSILSSKRRAK